QVRSAEDDIRKRVARVVDEVRREELGRIQKGELRPAQERVGYYGQLRSEYLVALHDIDSVPRTGTEPSKPADGWAARFRRALTGPAAESDQRRLVEHHRSERRRRLVTLLNTLLHHVNERLAQGGAGSPAQPDS